MGCDAERGQIDSSSGAVSIHAPAWGATLRKARRKRRPASFNPRTRVGCDSACRGNFQQGKVSIHAPAWGATQIYFVNLFREMFQSTHPRGVRLDRWEVWRFPILFQSTHPRGVRLVCHSVLPQCPAGFNPRTRVGCDSCLRRKRAYIVVSIHAPAWGATFLRQYIHACCRVSIHAPAWGATRCPASLSPSPFPLFQSTHPRGVRLHLLHYLLFENRFNPRTRVGCDCFHVLSSRFP